MSKPTRGTIGVYDCQVLAHYKFEGEQYIITLSSAEIASETKPGQFVHISVSEALPMRRLISIMSVDVENETFDLLYKNVGEGTLQLAERKIGEFLSVIGPIGVGFKLTDNKRPLLIGGGVGMPPMIAITISLQSNAIVATSMAGEEVWRTTEVNISGRELKQALKEAMGHARVLMLTPGAEKLAAGAQGVQDQFRALAAARQRAANRNTAATWWWH